MTELTTQEQQRYDRHLRLDQVGIKGQKRFKQTRILCVGAGGLGCPTLQYLTAAGIGHLGIIDHDQIELSNLQRQILFKTQDIGKNKAEQAAKHLSQLNPDIQIQSYAFKLNHQNVAKLFNQYDLIIDGTDNFETRYLINDYCCHYQKPFITAAIEKFQGQCALFTPSPKDQKTACYRCLFPEIKNPIQNCNETGVLGVLPGTLGSFQANLALQYILNHNTHLKNQLFIYDAQQMHFKSYKIASNQKCTACHNPNLDKDLEKKKMLEKQNQKEPITYINNQELQNLIGNLQEEQIKEKFNIIDVREHKEFAEQHLPTAVCIPLSELIHIESAEELPYQTQEPLIIYCLSGKRSDQAARLLTQIGFQNITLLQKGLLG